MTRIREDKSSRVQDRRPSGTIPPGMAPSTSTPRSRVPGGRPPPSRGKGGYVRKSQAPKAKKSR